MLFILRLHCLPQARLRHTSSLAFAPASVSMSTGHQSIDIPLSSLADDETTLEATVEGVCYQTTYDYWVLIVYLLG